MTTTSVTCEIRRPRAIQYLGCRGGDSEVILHLRTLLGVSFIPTQRGREWKTACDGKGGRKNLETAECASVPFVRFCSTNIEGHVLALSISADGGLCVCELTVCRACVAFGVLERDTGPCWDGSIKGHTGDTLGHLQRLIWWWEVTVVHHARL